MNRLHVRHILSLTAIPFLMGFLFASSSQHVFADEPTFLTIGNTPPSLTRAPTKTTDETSGTTSIEAVAVDQNSDDYYLLVCDSDKLTQKTDGSYMCGAHTLCVSPTTHSGGKTDCLISTVGRDIFENDRFFLFACDTAAKPRCSAPWTTRSAMILQDEMSVTKNASVLGAHTDL